LVSRAEPRPRESRIKKGVVSQKDRTKGEEKELSTIRKYLGGKQIKTKKVTKGGGAGGGQSESDG